jgi:alpha-glucosidase (family GH31 glycosyl hydrolase)
MRRARSASPLFALLSLVPLGALAVLAPAALGCTGTDAPTPTPAAKPVTVPATITLGGAQATVVLSTAPFRIQVKNVRGDVVLDGLDGAKDPSGDPSHPYGSLGAGHREVEITPKFVAGWDGEASTDDAWVYGSTVTAAAVEGDTAALDLLAPDGTKLHLVVEVVGADVSFDARVVSEPLATERPKNELGVAFALPADEHFYGLGERYVSVDHRGRAYYCWTEEGGIASGEAAAPGPQNPSPNGPSMTHVPVPFYLSSKGYGLWVDTTYRVNFDFGAATDKAFRLAAMSPSMRFHVFVRDDPKQILTDFTALTGRAHLSAPWVFGVRHRYDHDLVDGVDEMIQFRKKGIAMTMLDDTAHLLPNGFDPSTAGAKAQWTHDAHALGYKSICYYNAYVSTDSPPAKPLVDYGRAHDLFVRLEPAPGKAYGDEFITFMISGGGHNVLTIDFTRPEAVTWYQSLLQRGLDLGYDGWMLDFGEYLPENAKLYDGRSGWEAHNAFPLIYQKATTDYLRQVRGDDWMYFARAGWTGTQQYAPVTWSGDPAASFDDAKGLPAQVRAGINAGLSGIAFWGSDVDGYACNADPPPDRDVYYRWVEFGALSPDMHDENACAQAAPGAPPKWWIWSDAATTDVYARYAKLHTRLFPYTYAAALEATRTGVPIMRHPFLVNPELDGARASEFEYWFGPSLYVAPVVKRGATTRDAWLPPGTWFDWWTMAPLTNGVGGAKVSRDAPVDVLPMWLKSGGIVAMLDPKIDTLAPATDPSVVSLADVAGVLDVRAGIDATTQRGDAVLVDGTTLSVLMASNGAPVLPAGFTVAATDDELATCSACGKIETLASGAIRVRLTTAPTDDATVVAGPLVLKGWRFPKPTRVRWDVAVKP